MKNAAFLISLPLCVLALFAMLAMAQSGGLVAAYGFNEGSGTVATDQSGNGNSGTISGATWTTAGKYGGALSFNGSTDFVSVAAASSLNIGATGTMEAWVDLSALGRWNGVIAKGNVNDNALHNYAIEINTANRIECTVGNGSTANIITSTTTLTAGTFYHLGCTWDGSSLSLYVNGALDSSLTQSITPAGNAALLSIGQFGGNVDRFAGVIDEVRIYNRALSQAEIQTDMNTPVVGTPTPPDTTPPTVSLISPASGGIVAFTSGVSASASDDVGVAGVQFLLDGANLGPEVTAAPYLLLWDTTTVPNGPHTLSARARDFSGNSATSSPVQVTVSNSSDPAIIGQWAGPFSWPLVAVHAVLLKTGKVLVWAHGNSAQVWDPASGNFTAVPNSLTDTFCAGQIVLPDGRPLVVGGGGGGAVQATRDVDIFDPLTLAWSRVASMNLRRWYPTATVLPGGGVLATAGADVCGTCYVQTPEVYDPNANAWTLLPGAMNSNTPNYPFMFVLPDGRVLHAGASEFSTLTQVLDVAAQAWTVVDNRNINGGSAVMYLPGKIMKAGTASNSGFSGPAAATTYVLDMTQTSPAWLQTTSMALPRAFLNLTLLPDGSVLATGGELAKDGMDESKAVKEAELWSPITETWTTLSPMQTPRLYHSIGLLLPDGRVLVAGSGADPGVPDELSAEIFSPPYLFKGARPTISSAPASTQYGSSFLVATPDASAIASVSLIRPGAVTHFFNHEQRFLSLSFQRVAGGLNVQAPSNANLAPPGYYMLFIVNANGVPSMAPFVQLQ